MDGNFYTLRLLPQWTITRHCFACVKAASGAFADKPSHDATRASESLERFHCDWNRPNTCHCDARSGEAISCLTS